MYAISLYLDSINLESTLTIDRILGNHGFERHASGLYFGNNQVNAVTCVFAAMDLSRSLPWFSISVRDIRMLRIEEQNDLLPAVEQSAPTDSD